MLKNDCRGIKQKIEGIEPRKISLILEKFTFDELLSLLSCFSVLVKAYSQSSMQVEIRDDRNIILGFYKPGGFLAHFLNLAYKMNKPIFLFKTDPYMAIIPKLKDIHPFTDKNIFILDESVKTSFTYSLFENLYYRRVGKEPHSKVFTIFSYEGFEKILPDLDVIALYTLKDEAKIEESVEAKGLLRNSQEELQSIPENVTEALKKIVGERAFKNYIKEAKEKVEEVNNLSLIFASTTYLCAIAFGFADKIKDELKDEKLKKFGKNKILLFSATEDGQLLSFFIAFALKYNGKENKNLEVFLNFPEGEVGEDCKLDKTLRFLVEPSLASLSYYDLAWRMGKEKYMRNCERTEEKESETEGKGSKDQQFLNEFDKILLIKKPEFLKSETEGEEVGKKIWSIFDDQKD